MIYLLSKETTCCFTGHRVSRLPWRNNESDPRCIQLKNTLYDAVEAVYHSGIRHYICGMATGSDLFFCEAVIALRSAHPGITLEAAIPCPEQAQRWPESLQKRYLSLLSQCDFYTLVSKQYTADCMLRRNHYMVDQSSVLIAVYNGTANPRSGTCSTLLYAIRQGTEIIEITP
ncbi:MAG: SLOG family protein [Oscillospiraceae bacterium]